MGLKQLITENQDNTKMPLLSPLPQSFQSDNECSELSKLSLNIDKIVESLQVGSFHYIFLVVCGLCYAGYYLCYNTIGFIIITACDLHIHATNKGWLSLSYMAGLAASSLITGRLCDRFGRRKILIITMTIHLIGIITAALSYNYTILLITFAIIGTCDSGVLAATSTYSVEFFPRSHRAMASGTRVIISIIAIVYVSLIALLILPHHFNLYVGAIHISSWRIFILICVIPVIPAYIILFYMPESLRFVITTGKIQCCLGVR